MHGEQQHRNYVIHARLIHTKTSTYLTIKTVWSVETR